MPGKRTSRTTKTTLPAKMQKTSITSSPADEPTKLGASAKTQKAPVTSTDPDAATPKREPKGGLRSSDDDVATKKFTHSTSPDNEDVKKEHENEESISDDEDWAASCSSSQKRSNADPQESKPENFFKDLKLSTVSSRKVRSPQALTLRDEVILDGTGGTYGYYKLTFVISRVEGEGPWKVGCALGKAQYRILRIMGKRRGIKDKDKFDAFAQGSRSNAVDFANDDRGGLITVTTTYRNVARKDITVFVRANPTSNEWVLPRFKITKLRAGDKIFLTGMIRGYDQQSRHGTSFYLGSKIYLEQRKFD